MSGIRTIEDVRLRCHVDADTKCWHWRGAFAGTTPSMRIPALGRTVGAGAALCFLRTGGLPAAGAVWFRTCSSADCVAPHHRKVGTRREQMARLRGKPIKPTHRLRIVASRRAGSAIDEGVVAAIRASDATGKALAAEHGISIGHACRIKRGEARAPVGFSAFTPWKDAA